MTITLSSRTNTMGMMIHYYRPLYLSIMPFNYNSFPYINYRTSYIRDLEVGIEGTEETLSGSDIFEIYTRRKN